MRIYFARYTTYPKISEYTPHLLESYLTFNRNFYKLIESVNKHKVRDLFLDSGAFSAFTRGANIDIDEYIDFCIKVKDYAKIVANLDVIGNNKKSYENWLYIRSKGVNALPVIQYGAREEYFDLYLKKHNEKYIALGGLVPHSIRKKELRNWLDFCFHLIKKYWPVKVHLFGITNANILKDYPAYSCDGTSWLQGGKFGATFEYKDFSIKRRKLADAYKGATSYKYKDEEHVKHFLKLEKQVTDLWKTRGIVWD